jgi:exonuclease VII small subunit
MTVESTGDDVPVSELSYTEASRELDAIVSFFEQREVDVDQLVVRLERATAIVDELDRRVRRTRTQVEELVPRLEAVNRNLGNQSDGAAVVDQSDVDEDEIGGSWAGAGDEEGDDQALF